MQSRLSAVLSTSLLAASLLSAPNLEGAFAAQGDYVGSWSVLILTKKAGSCEGAYRYTVNIAPNGSITYGGPSDFTASGRVSANGAVSVRISRGDQAAQGAGKLTGTRGRGSWSSPTGGCSGTWRAERRG